MQLITTSRLQEITATLSEGCGSLRVAYAHPRAELHVACARRVHERGRGPLPWCTPGALEFNKRQIFVAASLCRNLSAPLAAPTDPRGVGVFLAGEKYHREQKSMGGGDAARDTEEIPSPLPLLAPTAE